MTTTHTSDDNIFEIPLELSDKLKSKGIIQKFVKNKKHNYIKIELNHKYEKSIVVVPTNNLKNWTKFHKSVEQAVNYKGVYDKEDIRLIQNAIDDNHELILGITYDNDYDNDLLIVLPMSSLDSMTKMIERIFINFLKSHDMF